MSGMLLLVFGVIGAIAVASLVTGLFVFVTSFFEPPRLH